MIEGDSGVTDTADATRRSVDPFLEAKLHRPPVREDWVDRVRLRDQLDACSERPVVLVSAAAGYGKTTLVAQWLAGRSRTATTAWVSLDPADKDPGRLWTHVGHRARAGRLRLGVDAAGVRRGQHRRGRDRGAAAVCTHWRPMPEDVVIVARRLPLRPGAGCHSQVEFLVENLPPQAHLVIMTRADPGLRLGRLRASGSSRRSVPHDLGFTRRGDPLLAHRTGVTLSTMSVTRLVRPHRGMAGGALPRLAVAGGRGRPGRVRPEFSGGNRFIGDYLTEEVLSRHTDEVREFISTMSILDRFSAPLCDFVAETSGSAAILRELERSQPVPDPARRERPLVPVPPSVRLRGAQRARGLDQPERVAGLHARAARLVPRPRRHRRGREALAGRPAAPARRRELVQANWLPVRRRRARGDGAWAGSTRSVACRSPAIPRRASRRRGWRRCRRRGGPDASTCGARGVRGLGPLPDGAGRWSRRSP